MNTTDIIGRIVADEVYVNASQMVQQLLDGGLCLESASFAELHSECLVRPDYSEAPDGYEVSPHGSGERYVMHHFTDPEVSVYDTKREAIQAAWEDSGEEPPMEEALQHWLVSDWLADKLELEGAMVARDVLGLNVWGRAECGQALTDDADLRAVAAGLA